MVCFVRGPTWRWLLHFALLMGLLIPTGCASDSESDDSLVEAVEDDSYSENGEATGEEESADGSAEGNTENAFSNNSEGENYYAGEEGGDNVYNNFNVEQSLQSDGEDGNYSYDNLGEGDNTAGLEDNLANNSYNVDAGSENNYSYQEDSQSYNSNFSEAEGNTYQENPGELAQAMDSEYAGNSYGDSINSYNETSDSDAMSALDAESANLAQESGNADYGDAYGDDMASGDMSGMTDMGGMAAGSAGLPEIGSKMSYIVQQGDTLGTIASLIYGNQDKWQEIQMLTGFENPNLIYPGDVVYYQLTAETQAFAAAYENTTKGEVTVSQGDTLSSLAQSIYGDYGQWKALWRANDSIDDPDRLIVGQTVYYVNYSSMMAAKASWQQFFAAQSETTESVEVSVQEAGETLSGLVVESNTLEASFVPYKAMQKIAVRKEEVIVCT